MRLVRIASAMFACLVLAAAAAPSTAFAQQTADVIRGRVIGPDSQPVANAQVTTVSYFGGITRTKRTDRDGRFSIVYPNGEGDYWISFAAIGFQAQRFEIKRRADEEVLIANVKLSATVTLAQVNVTANANRQPPARSDAYTSSELAGTDKSIAGALLPPELAGNLAAMASATPGIQLIPGLDGNPDKFSFLGLDGAQNNSSINGQQSEISNIPRDAAVSSGLRAGYDIANGGFSGAQIAINTISGTNYIARSASGMFNAPQAQWNDRVGTASEYSSASIGGRWSGPITMDRNFYNTSFQLDRRSQGLPTLLSSSAVVFQSAGIASDSVTRLRSILGSLGAPAAARQLGAQSIRTNASLLGTFDWAPKSSSSGQAFTLALNGAYNAGGPQANAASQTPSSLAEFRAMNGGAQLRHTNYFGRGILTESQLGVSASQNRNVPYVVGPGGSVLVTSALNDGTSTARTLAFGGAATDLTTTNRSVSGRNMLSWFSGDSRHRYRLISELRLDNASSARANNLLGRYTYQSLADLEAGRPSSYTRSLNAVEQSANALVGALAIGDAWRPTNDVQVQYGVRLDGNRFLTRPDENPAIRETFGVSNASVPNGIYVSPRLGFSWLYGKAPQIPYADGFVNGPRATIRGGIGIFQNMRGPDLVTTALTSTGLPSSQQTLVCTGDATPLPDWDVLAGTAPVTCANGSTGSVFASSSPNVTLFAPGYGQEKSLRTNVSWSGAAIQNRFTVTLNSQYSYNLNQSDGVDLNFVPERRFALDNEGGRPVFVLPTSIDTRSGLIAARDARRSQAFNAVTALQSNLHSQSGQFTLSVAPLNYSPTRFRWSASYNLLYTHQQFRGFSSTTSDPLAIEGGIGSQPMHDIGYSFSYNLWNALTLTWGGRLTSGTRFTPVIGGDVNGDGRWNDRAFIFDPAASGDAGLKSAMQSLLDNGSGSARECLRKQLGQFASRNSCSGPWTMGNTTLRVALNTSRIRLPQRTNLTFTVSNPIGLADLALHGENKLHGWGQTPFIDNSLLFVRGFDPATNRFRYDVNQRFGSTRASQITSRTPVVLTMQLSVDLAPTRDWQTLRQQLDRGRSRAGTKLPEGSVRAFSSSVFPNPMARLLQSAEQLHLTRRQADSLATMSRRMTRIVDSVWTPAAKYLAALPNKYEHADAQQRLIDARRIAAGYLITVAPHVRKMLTKGQMRMLPTAITNMLEPRYLELLRNGQVGSEFGYFFF